MIETNWKAYVQGAISREEAIKHIVSAIRWETSNSGRAESRRLVRWMELSRFVEIRDSFALSLAEAALEEEGIPYFI